MKNIFIKKPSFEKGNIGDMAIMISLKKIYKEYNLIIPQTYKKCKKIINSNYFDKIDLLLYVANDCIYCHDINDFILKKFLENGKKVYIINLSWGPNGHNYKLLQQISQNNNLQIIVRDKYSLHYLNKKINFINKPILSIDLAFLCNKRKYEYINELGKWINKNERKIIGINIHKQFGKFNKNIIQEIIKFIIKNRNKYRFLFIPHDKRKKEYENLFFIKKFLRSIDIYVSEYMNPEYEKYITSKLYFVITCRMHLAILTLPNKIPCICISYNGIKAKGTYEHFNIEELVIEPEKIDLLEERCNKIENNYKYYQEKLSKNIIDKLKIYYKIIKNE